MKVSIITATYNSEKTLRACLDSVASQKAIADIEHIVIDGRSTDTTLAILADYPHLSQVLSQQDRGIYHAFNRGVALATGELIYFLNSDDSLLDQNVISDVIAAFTDEVDFYCGVVLFINTPDGLDYFSSSRTVDHVNFKPRHQAFFCRRTLFSKLGPFNESLKIAADTYFMKDAIKRARGVFTDRGIARFSLLGVSSDEQNLAKVVEQDAIVDTLLGNNSVYSDMSKRLTLQLRNLNYIKSLFLSSIHGGPDLTSLLNLKIGVFGTRELSQIFALLLRKQGVDIKCFIVSKAGLEDTILTKPVIMLQELKAVELDVVINCVEGDHEVSINQQITKMDQRIKVLSWRQLC